MTPDTEVAAVKRSDYYYLNYGQMVSGYRHAYKREIPGGRSEIKSTRDANHPADPRCPGCVETSCLECGASTHPSLSPCIHQPEGPAFRARMDALYRRIGLKL